MFRLHSPALLLLLWISFVHLTAIYLFTSGFLLTRLALTNISTCSDGSCSLPPTHTKALVLIIDSLRFDFIAPAPFIPSANSSEYSSYHHSILTLPSLLTNAHPSNSFIFNSYPDPPTTTLQRIKGITTGSLPTFVDSGSNFGASEIAEDSIVGQVGANGGEAAFMGDDTWMNVFPNAFHVNMTWPYDSFNVEDLHTVDNGVITHLFPLLQSAETPDLIIGHFLGVDHVGHRVGPSHPSMHSKLLQMNATLSRVVDLLPKDTLLVVLGDHGMDRAGDHGGDSDLETNAAVWIYSKSVQLFQDKNTSRKIPSELLPYATFPNAASPYRRIQQIDLVPTLSLLLGLPIPFNNLGTVIPELFWRHSSKSDSDSPVEESWSWTGSRKVPKNENFGNSLLLARALQVNAQQIHSYLDTYRASSSGAELDDAWSALGSAWSSANKTLSENVEDQTLVDLWNYTRLALSSCRAMWAQFNPLLMILGLISLAASLLSTYAVYTGISRVATSSSSSEGNTGVKWEEWLMARLWQAVRGFAGGATLGFLASLTYETQLQTFGKGMDSLDCILFMAPFASCVMVAMHSLPKNYRIVNMLSLLSPSNLLVSLPFILHAVAFFSNSFTFWEDRIVAFLLPSSLLPHILIGIRAPTARLRRRILGFIGLLVVCARIMAVSTVCREEQHPYCHVTFYSSSSASSALENAYTSAVVPPSASSSVAPLFAVIGAPLMALLLPIALRFFLAQSKSDQGLAGVWFTFIVTPSLLCGTGYWLIEYAETAGIVDESEWGTILRFCRTSLAWAAIGWPTILGGFVWWNFPMCISVETGETTEGQRSLQVKILGFANAYGAPYLLFWSIPFCTVWASSQLTAQIMLGLSAVALVSYLEVMDGVRDVQAMEDVFASNRLSDMISSTSNGGDDFGLAAQQNSYSPKVNFSEITPIVLLAMHVLFRTGHQSTMPSMQWKSGFLLTSTVAYPWSPATVVLNSVGPMWTIGVGAGLVGVWLKAPRFSSATGPSKKDGKVIPPTVSANNQIQLSTLLSCLCLSMYFLTILLTTSLSAAILRRHLMVWKVFAPRWILGVLGVLTGDASVLTVYLGVWRVRRVVDRTFVRLMGGTQ
ncbi:hypothetical protein GYMLUDRAFT_260111 [Collybiopsis luxurians FD-317 M1]|uniref:Uncharacterized protein n=1 Tax=Collybiopsis luxurians FD-317 M1 TaxID=944289 RepID=A0A0D0CI60_9AGAR|nr:hypothetical protein GYMLUDRAFT_260111 [Collybiopsis luxurians FD-317 M1]